MLNENLPSLLTGSDETGVCSGSGTGSDFFDFSENLLKKEFRKSCKKIFIEFCDGSFVLIVKPYTTETFLVQSSRNLLKMKILCFTF